MILNGNIKDIIPIIKKMVNAKKGKIDIGFFKNMILKKKVEEKRNICGKQISCKVDYINGWIVKFFGYLKDRNDKLIQFSSDEFDRETIKDLPSQIINIPFKIINHSNNEKKNIKFEAGIFGCALNEKKEISLGIGWLVSPSNSPEKGKEDEQFESLKEKYYDNKRKRNKKIQYYY